MSVHPYHSVEYLYTAVSDYRNCMRSSPVNLALMVVSIELKAFLGMNKIKGFSKEAIGILMHYSLPGNVRDC